MMNFKVLHVYSIQASGDSGTFRLLLERFRRRRGRTESELGTTLTFLHPNHR